MKKYKLGIIGASGLVGQTMLKVLKEEKLLKEFELFLITSEKNDGKEIWFAGKKYKYIKLSKKCLNLGLDAVIFAAGEKISKLFAYDFAEKGTFVIDNSNAFRRQKDIPLVVPEINKNLITKNTKIIANPNCSTIQLAVVLHRLMSLAKIEKVIVSSYQSVSGAGAAALKDLKDNTGSYFGFKIKNNFVPAIGEINEKGFCTEEDKIMFEINKILEIEIDVLATTVRVPISNCHGESVYIKFLQKIDEKYVKNALKCDFVENFDKVCLPTECFGSNKTHVCRLRKVGDCEYLMFIIADNLRRGAAYNAVLILNELKKYLKDL